MKKILIALILVFLLSLALASSNYGRDGLLISENKQCVREFYFDTYKLKPGWNFYPVQKIADYYLVKTPFGDCNFIEPWHVMYCCERLGLYKITSSPFVGSAEPVNAELRKTLGIIFYLITLLILFIAIVGRKSTKVNSLINFFFPRFSMVSLFVMSLILVYIFIFSSDFIADFGFSLYTLYSQGIVQESPTPIILIALMLFMPLVGVTLSFYYALSNKLASGWKRILLIIYGLFLVIMVGLISAEVLREPIPTQISPFGEVLIIFSAYNLFQAIFIMLFIFYGNTTIELTEYLSNAKPRRKEIIAAFLIVTVLFFGLKIFAYMPWFLIATICFSLTSLFIKPVEMLLSEKQGDSYPPPVAKAK